MFNVGDKVVYPMHGAGIIEAIEEKEILGATKKYYIMKMPIGEMKVMIPLDNVKEVGLRQIIDDEGVNKVLNILKQKHSSITVNWNRRYRMNMEKIKSGNIFKVAEVVRNLMLREREKGLSTGERKMLESAKQILVSELVLAKGVDEDKVLDILDEVFEHRK
ncbi:MAG: CarD family transcriptional regulator [Candidatus Syntrophonatronum acetioxidans]|uniref:CarD family transcriptional regulator n=1 Tax=Candidatus Syntrophonatronum acetioxidans TaxID=1795816 RepID=A0A424YGE1_9FIRM|nr:MAG: CarD family transcriptional regulator [Candidatus Syntrophonatronum acetioxidans]